MRIRVRLTIWYSLLLAAIIAALGGFLVVQLRADLVAVIDREVRDRIGLVARELTEEIEDERSLRGVAKDFRNLCLSAAPGAGTAAALFGPDGQTLISCRGNRRTGPQLRPDPVARASTGRVLTVDAEDGEDRWRLSVAYIDDLAGTGRGALVVAESLHEVDEAVERVLVLLLLAGPAALAATALGGWWLARAALRPVERMTTQAREIGIDRLDERIPVPRAADEIATLGTTLNAMLDRLERGVDDKHRLVADASHELRTPLTVMRAELDVSLRSDYLNDASRAVLESVRSEVDTMSRTVDNLLTLAQVDEGRLELLLTDVELRDAIEAAARPLLPVAALRGVRLVTGDVRQPVRADAERLRHALTNLIDNAIKFTSTEVRVEVWREGSEAGVTVTDDGPGIPAAAREHVFDRFYRASADHETTPRGSGLGLAICREVAHAHGGRVWVQPGKRGGSEFSLALPLRDGSARETLVRRRAWRETARPHGSYDDR